MMKRIQNDYKEKSEVLINTIFPGRIQHLQNILTSTTFNKSGINDQLGVQDGGAGGTLSSSTPGPASKRPRTDGAGRSRLPSNDQIDGMIRSIKPLLVDLAEQADAIMMWIHLSVPRIEDGNNFGVSVQENALILAADVKTMAAGYLEAIPDYYDRRGYLASKMLKYPMVADYRQSITELDEGEVHALRAMAVAIRNCYANLLDTVVKNREKIERPRQDDISRNQVS